MSTPNLGDVIFAKRSGYNHYGVYAGNNKVIHYCKDEKGLCKGIIKETSLYDFLDGDSLYICNFNKDDIMALLNKHLGFGLISMFAIKFLLAGNEQYRSSSRIFSPNETVARARSRLGEGGYSLIFHNCEHFALWCKTGVATSEQVKNILRLVNPFPISI